MKRKIGLPLVLTLAAGMALASSAASAQTRTLQLLSNGGTIDKAMQDALSDFEKTHDVTLRWIPGNSADSAAKVVATKDRPEYDIFMGDDIAYQTLSDRGLLAKIDKSIVKNYADLRPQAMFKGGDGVIVGFNFSGLFYAVNEFKKNNWAPPTSWDDLYRPEFCKRVGLFVPTVSYTMHFAVATAGGNLDKVSDAITNKMSKLKGCVPTLESSSAKMEEKLQLGEYLIGVHGSVRILPLAVKGVPLRFVIPKEGAIRSSTSIAVIKGAPNEKLAQEFVNAILAPKAQEMLMNAQFFLPVNKKVVLPKKLLDLGLPTEADLEKALVLDNSKISEHRREWSRLIERELAP